MRASERNVLDVAAAMSGGPPRSRCPASWAMSARIFLRSARISFSPGIPSRKWSRASRAAPIGIDQATSGSSSAPPAISSEPPPMSKTASRPADQPNHRRTARKVSRASSSPGRTAMRTPVSSATWSRTASQLSASRTAEVANPSMSCAPLSSATTTASATNLVSALMPDRVISPSLEVLGEAQRLLVGVRRQRGRAAVGVDHQEMTGVGADVEDAEAHAPESTVRHP